MTSAEQFPEEPQIPPIVLDTTDLPVGSIVAFDQNQQNDVRIPITVRDDNVDDPVQIQARLSVVGQAPYDFYCASVPPNGEPIRAQYELDLPWARIRKGACTKVEVAVSSRFAKRGECGDPFGVPANYDEDLARGLYWIFETSDDPIANPTAAQNLINSCQTVLSRVQTNSSPAVP